MFLLTTIWFLLVKPEGTLPQPQLKEFEIEQVEFSTLDDCETYARLYAQKHAHAKRGTDVSATYTCISRDR
jgi:hypothetical protein